MQVYLSKSEPNDYRYLPNFQRQQIFFLASGRVRPFPACNRKSRWRCPSGLARSTMGRLCKSTSAQLFFLPFLSHLSFAKQGHKQHGHRRIHPHISFLDGLPPTERSGVIRNGVAEAQSCTMSSTLFSTSPALEYAPQNDKAGIPR